jgi:hypothetical protein
MKFIAKKQLNIVLRCPKLFTYKNENYLLGGECINSTNNIMQYWSCIYKLDRKFDVIHSSKYQVNLPFINKDDTHVSCWTRDINIVNNKIYFNIEIKKNVNNEMFEHYNYVVFTENLIDYFVKKQYHNFENYFLFKELNLNDSTILLLSRMEIDKEFPEFVWGKYLFEFKINNKYIMPIFDACVDYKIDKGHLLHNVIQLNETEYNVIFTIRHLINNKPEFIYKMYSSKTTDFINFTDTSEISCVNNVNDAKWYSYPSIFKHNDTFYALANQDEFGKNKNVLLFNVEM